MDDGGSCENGRHRPDQYKSAQGQWLVQTQPSMKQIMAIMAERDSAIHERNLAFSEKKAAIAERDMAFLQRDSAIAERNNALIERDNAIATLQYHENSLANRNTSSCPPGCQISRTIKHIHHLHNEPSYRDPQTNETAPMAPVSSEALKPRRAKRSKDLKPTPPNKKATKSQKIKSENDPLAMPKPDWKSQDLGLNRIAYDETTMPAPVCSCTGTYRQCYKWGSGGWQSSCCTTTLSMYPLPAVPNKRHARIGGRKMSGSAYSKLLSRLAAEGYDLSNPVDLKEHWAKHGTNRYITIK